MMKRTLYTFLAAAAISAPAMIAPAIFTPAAAQVGVNLNIGMPMPMAVPFFEAVPASRPGYLWQTGYWRGEGTHRYWEHGRWQEERHFAEHRREERRGWNEHGHYYR
jgi:hypothetical protein